MNIFSKAAQNLPLTPAQRAFLKLLKGWLLTAIAAGITAGAQYVLGNQQVDWQKLLYLTVGALILSILSAFDKYWTAQGDTPLALATQAAEQKVQQALQNATTPPAQQPQAPKPILLPTLAMPQNVNATAIQPLVQQVPFPSNPFTPPINPQALPAVNLANPTPAQDNSTRHFGDSSIMPVVSSNQQ